MNTGLGVTGDTKDFSGSKYTCSVMRSCTCMQITCYMTLSQHHSDMHNRPGTICDSGLREGRLPLQSVYKPGSFLSDLWTAVSRRSAPRCAAHML